MNVLLAQMRSMEHLILSLQHTTCLEYLQGDSKITPGLNALSSNLERFIINPVYISFQVATDRAYDRGQGGMKFLTDLIKSFERLTVLFLPLPLFLGWGVNQQPLPKVLPTNLGALNLRDCFLEKFIPRRWPREMFRVLSMFLLNEAPQFPHLRSIMVYTDPDFANTVWVPRIN